MLRWLLSACCLLGMTVQSAAFPLDWTSLRNPILQDPARCLKDPSVVYHEGWFYVYSNRNHRTQDFRTFTPLQGTGSQPDVTHNGAQWIMAHNGAPPASWHEPESAAPKLRRSNDLVRWTPAQELLPGLGEARNIDPAIAWDGPYAYVALKRKQKLYVTRMPREALGTTAWESLQQGQLDGAWGEQFQLLTLHGQWHLLATGRRANLFQMLCLAWYPYTCNHHPFLYTKQYPGTRLVDWTQWTQRRELRIPQERWNKAMHANGAYLVDWRPHDGYYYLFYAGSADHTRFNNRGHCKLGMARSKDLYTWAVPGQDP